MAEPSEFTSSLIASGASGYAQAAAYRLLERRPEVGERFGTGAFRSWSQHLTVRLKELAAAMLVEEPGLFAAEVGWSEVSFRSREVPVEDLRTSLECLRDTLQEELPEEARATPAPYFEQALARLSEPAPAVEPALGEDSTENRLALRYLETALAGDRRGAIELLLAAFGDGIDVLAAYRVLQIAQSHVGDLWHARELAVSQEHFVTATTEAAMTLLALQAAPEAPSDHTVVVSPVPGNTHELGAKALAHRFEMAGWRTIYLGSELPAAELAGALEIFDAQLLALSVALSPQLRGTIDTIRRARTQAPAVKILVGGRVFAVAPELWRKVGADGSASDSNSALEQADRLLS